MIDPRISDGQVRPWKRMGSGFREIEKLHAGIAAEEPGELGLGAFYCFPIRRSSAALMLLSGPIVKGGDYTFKIFLA